MPSEIKRLLETIEQEELAALRGMSGLASVARHDFIQARQTAMDAAYTRLRELIGEDVANDLTLTRVNCAHLLYEKERWIAQLQQERLKREQIEIENARTGVQHPTPFHMHLHKKPHDDAREGDILLYKLRPYDQPKEPDRLWRGIIKHILTDRYNKRDYFVESVEHPGTDELVYGSQVYDFQAANQ